MPPPPPSEPAGHRDGAFGLLERDGCVLLLRNPRLVGGQARSLWDLPGGSLELHEDLVQALKREWMEETGLAVQGVGRLRLVVDGAKRRAAGSPPLYTWRAFVFEVEAEGEPRPGEGIDEVRFVERGAAVDLLTAPYHGPLRRMLRGDDRTHALCEWIDPVPAAAAPPRLRRLLVVAAAAAAGHAALVEQEVAAALEAGVAAEELAETLLQIVPYAGFPRAIAAFTASTLTFVSDTNTQGGDDGEAVFGRVYGDTAERVADGLAALHPALKRWTHAFAYGTVLGRPVLSLLERELLAVSILTALGRLDDPLLGHMRAALRLGAAKDDVVSAIAAVPRVLGEAKREAAFALVARL